MYVANCLRQVRWHARANLKVGGSAQLTICWTYLKCPTTASVADKHVATPHPYPRRTATTGVDERVLLRVRGSRILRADLYSE